MRAATEENGEEIIATFLAAMKAEKKVHTPTITCKKCGDTRTYSVVVPDARAASAAVDIFLTQSHGRPGVDKAAEAEAERITFHRTIVYAGEKGEGDNGASVIKTAIDLCETQTAAEVREWLLGLQQTLRDVQR